MRRWKKLALVLLGLIVLSQVPFAYRRYRLGRLHAAILDLRSQRSVVTADGPLTDYKGVMHVHSLLGGHSTGTLDEIIRAAGLDQLRFVVMTEHPAENLDTAEMTLKGFHAGILFVPGSEIASANHDRFLMVPGSGFADRKTPASDDELVNRKKASGSLAFIAYPEDFHDWGLNDFDGIEVYNLFTNARKINPLVMFFDGLWSFGSYPELLYHTFKERPAANLKRWDRTIAEQHRRIVAVAGNDAHANIGLSLGDATGKKLFKLQLDPYERSFSLLHNHVLIEKEKPLAAETLLGALAAGHSYVSFDLFADAAGFGLTADNGGDRKIMGDEIDLRNGVRLAITTPVRSRIVLFRDGEAIQEAGDVTSQEFSVTRPGAYRVEAYLDRLPLTDKLWIISNPIYVR